MLNVAALERLLALLERLCPRLAFRIFACAEPVDLHHGFERNGFDCCTSACTKRWSSCRLQAFAARDHAAR
jgi:type II secretory pathway component PulJ